MGDSNDTKALHFDVRYDAVDHKKIVVMNSKTAGEFGKEEKTHPKKFVFTPATDFDIIFQCREDHFKVNMIKIKLSQPMEIN